VTPGTNVNAVHCEALFASPLQRSDTPTLSEVRDAVHRAERDLGAGGCAASVAQEFGDHPETAILRMRWARQLVEAAFLAAPVAGLVTA
jgi:predicted TIM-barrel enzyme